MWSVLSSTDFSISVAVAALHLLKLYCEVDKHSFCPLLVILNFTPISLAPIVHISVPAHRPQRAVSLDYGLALAGCTLHIKHGMVLSVLTSAACCCRFPIRFTLDQQRCVPSSPTALSECLDYDNSGIAKCQTDPGANADFAASASNADGRSSGLLDCAPVLRIAMDGQVGRANGWDIMLHSC